MKVILTTLDGNIFPVEVSAEIELLNLKALCEQETRISADRMTLFYEGKPLTDVSKSLAAYNVKENDMIMVQESAPAAGGNLFGSQPASAASGMDSLPSIDFSSITVPTTSRPRSSNSGSSSASASNMANMRRMIMSDPAQFEMIRQKYPELADAAVKNDTGKMLQIFNQLQSSLSGGMGGAGSLFGADYSGDYMDIEAQQKIAENIRLQNIQQNMESALEYMPEAFGNVVMLYINCTVNGHPVKAFVDSGAQMTIMSSACAERCGIMRLVDSRWAGIAKGVGTQKIVGRVHLTQIKIENSFLTTSFSILEEQPMDMLLGLDMLRRHQCIIDLSSKNSLIFTSAGIETKFLPESELPGFAKPEVVEETADEDDEMKKALEESKKSAQAGTTSSAANFPEETITNLMKLGANREDVIAALKEANGDQNMAQVKLLAKLLQSPSKK